ncbi:seizure 6-like protein isoform X2 [Photinus pyralis]|uniref:seizure 6-like protein isoform X2 n=1 Tax=Photinus pyralis TaxID=7054 RepID=UPI00126718BC|nr:seizure 6-like protein isoform X2 [Photinus pyralis]
MWFKIGLLLILVTEEVRGYIEYVETSGCESCVLRLTCRHLNSIISVLEANFEVIESYINETLPTPFPPMHPRIALNQRCSGVNHCSFILTKDCPGADKWGLGNLTVNYACISDRLTKYCNKEILLASPETFGISRGFIHNPGYPRFYLGKQKCRWTIHAPPLQRVKVTIYDISLVADPNLSKCSDIVEVSDRGQILYSTCEQHEPPLEITSLDDTLDVTLIPSPKENLLPRRGIMFYYTAVGCSTPIAPKDGYLVYRNDTVAEYSCCVGYAFPDTRIRSRIIKCLGYRWNTTVPLPDCKCNATLSINETITTSPNNTNKVGIMTVSNDIEEIVIPSIVIVALFLINAVVLFVIYRYKKRKLPEFTEEELGTLSTNQTKTLQI